MLGLIAEVLDAPMVDRAVDKRWLGSGAGGRSTWTAVPEVERELSLLVTEMDRLMDALAEGTAPKDEIIARLNEEKPRKPLRVAERMKLSEPAGIESFDDAKLKRERHERVADVKPLLAESSHPSPDTADAASWRSGI